MKKYSVTLSRRSLKTLARLNRADQQKLRAAIDLLEETPRPPKCIKLKNNANTYRVRVGHFRIVYDVYDSTLTILVINLGHRKDIYRNL